MRLAETADRARSSALVATVAANIKGARLAHSPPLSQHDLAELSGVTRGLVSRAERRTMAITLVILEKLATGLDLPAADLLRPPGALK